MKSHLLFLFTVGCICICQNGCATRANSGKVAKDWSRTIREQQIIPIFPPREDIRVGDVFAFLADPDDDNQIFRDGQFLPIPNLFAALDVNDKLLAHYSSRPEFAATPSSIQNATNSDLSAVEAITEQLFQKKSPNRLRNVAFPDFSVVKISTADLRGSWLINALPAAFGLSLNKNSDIYLKISSGESYSLPMPETFEMFKRELLVEGESDVLKPKYRDVIEQMFLQSDSIHFSIVNEVFYARSLDILISDAQSFGAAAAIATPPTKPGIPVSATNLTEIANELSTNNNALIEQKFPGGSLSIVQASGSTITMRKTFSRPIAIGIRAYTQKIVRPPANTSPEAKSISYQDSEKRMFLLISEKRNEGKDGEDNKGRPPDIIWGGGRPGGGSGPRHTPEKVSPSDKDLRDRPDRDGKMPAKKDESGKSKA